MKTILSALLVILALFTGAHAQKLLHVSTIPSNADIYIGTSRPDLADKPDYVSSAFVSVSEEQALMGEVLLHLFRPEFTDTTIRVTLSPKDTSYLIVSLHPTYDDNLIKEQNDIVAKRGRRSFGYKMMIGSAIPLFVSGIAGAVTYYQISRAEDAKKTLEKTRIHSQSYENAKQDFRDSRDKAKTARKTTIAGLATGATLLTLGFILSF